MTKIHPTAIIDPAAKIADDVEIGPFCVIESDVTIGPGCKLAPSVVIRRHTTMGSNNTVDSNTVIGGVPQDQKFDPDTVSYVKIGDGNVFRESVTVNRATGEGNSTVIGNNNYLMTSAHAGHNSVLEDDVVMVNGSSLGGFAHIGCGVVLSLNSGIHQFVRVGEMVMFRGHSGASSHVPPYVMVGQINGVVGLNKVGLKRAEHISNEDRRQIKEAFELTFRSGLPTNKALEKMDACTDWSAAAIKFRDFVHWAVSSEAPYNRGLSAFRPLRNR